MAFGLQAQTYDWQWAYRGGGTQNSGTGATWGEKLEQIYDVKIDQDNNFYFAGTVLNFNPSFKGEDITKYGTYSTDNDIYIVSLDCEGNFRWHTTIGGHIGAEYTVSMALDTLGGLYISFSTPNFARPNNNNVPPHYAPGVALGSVFSNIPHPDARQIALIKYDTTGNYLWHQMPQDENVTSIQTDGYFYSWGGAYSLVAEPDGTLHWHCQFLPGNHLDGDLVVTEAMSPYHAILKYDKDGNYLGHFPIPLGGAISKTNVKMYYETLNERYYIGIGLHTANNTPAWDGEELYGAIIALDSQGNELWSHKSPLVVGSTTAVFSIATDAQSNVYLSGTAYNTSGISQFAGYNFTHTSRSPYLIKLDSEGNLIWGTNLNPGTASGGAAANSCDGCKGRDLAINGDEIAMATGLHENTWGSIAMPRLYGHQQDPVLIRFDKETGVPFAMHDIEGPGGVRDELMTVEVDHNGNYIVGGYGRSTLFLNHDTIDPIYSMGGDSDFFVAKLAKNTDCSIDECFGIVVPAPAGDSNQTLNAGMTLANLDVEGENLQWYADAELTEPLAETYIVENNTTYYVTQTIGVCSGETALAVTVIFQDTNPCQGVEVPAPQGDSSQTIASGMTLADLNVDGENLQWYADPELTEPLAETHVVTNGATYYVTQTIDVCTSEALAVTVTTQGTNPCEDVVVPAPQGDSSQTIASGMTLADLNVDGENLQWYADAELTEPLAETHIVENNTTYYVTQTIGVCTSEALAVEVTTLGVSEFQKLEVVLHPNPTSGMLYIEASQELQSYEVYNLIGQRLLSNSFTGSIDMKDLSKGTYIIRLTTPNGEVFTEKVVKE